MSAPFVDPYVLPDNFPREKNQRIKVLSLSGGGYRGLFTAAVIKSLEAQLSTSHSQLTPFGQHFDLIAGTSIGGILAAALSNGVTGADIQAVLVDRGRTIFPAIGLRGLRKLIGQAPYKAEHLRAAIKTLIPDADKRPLGQHASALLLTSVNWTTSKLHLLGSSPTCEQDSLGLTLMDAMLATSAAPAHFPPHAFQHHLFVDGGLAANAPDLHALECAKQMYPNAEIQMLSIGTANPLHGRDPSAVPSHGVMWAGPVIELVMNAQEMLAVQECEKKMGPHRYFRLNVPPSSLQEKQMDFDIANKVSTDLLLSLADDCFKSLRQDKNEWNRLMTIIR